MKNLNYNTNTVRNITMTNRSRQEQAEYDEALEWLLNTLAESKRIAREEGWISQEEIEREFIIPQL